MSGGHIPGDARRWHVLARLAEHPEGLTARDFLDMHGIEGRPDTLVANGSPWQTAMSHICADLRSLERDGLAKRIGKVREGWSKGNPAIWAVTDRGRTFGDEIMEKQEALAAAATRRSALRDAAAAKRGMKARLDKAAAAIAASFSDVATPEERQEVAVRLRRWGATYDQIGVATHVSRECARLDLAAAAARGLRAVKGEAAGGDH